MKPVPYSSRPWPEYVRDLEGVEVRSFGTSMNKEEHRKIISRFHIIIAIVLSTLLVGMSARIVPIATAKGSRLDCIVHRAKVNGNADWTNAGVIWTLRQQSLYGCEG